MTIANQNSVRYAVSIIIFYKNSCSKCQQSICLHYEWRAPLMFSRESSAQTQATCNEVMDLQVDYWTTGGKKESNKVNYNLVPRLSPHNPKLNWVN